MERNPSDDINEKMKKLKPFIDGGQLHSHHHEGEKRRADRSAGQTL